jgi:hypothetical protein
MRAPVALDGNRFIHGRLSKNESGVLLRRSSQAAERLPPRRFRRESSGNGDAAIDRRRRARAPRRTRRRSTPPVRATRSSMAGHAVVGLAHRPPVDGRKPYDVSVAISR